MISLNKISRAAAFAAALVITAASFSACSDNSSSDTDKTSSKSSVMSKADTSVSAEDLDVGYDEESAGNIVFAEGSATVDTDGAEADGAKVTIKNSGEYVVSGKASDGQLVIDAQKDAEIKLIFKGLDLTCSDNAPVYVKKAKKVFITLEDGSENVLTDGEKYELGDDENTDACLFSKGDLTINGSGSLTVNANYKHGIVSKDDLVITDGTISVTSESSAVVGKDCVKISGGKLELDAGTNGVKSNNKDDDSKGFISISGGEISIISNGDAFEAETFISVEDGTVKAVTGGSSSNASMKEDGTPNENWQKDMQDGGGGFGGKDLGDFKDFGGGDPPEMPDGQQMPDMPDGFDPNDLPEGFDPNNKPDFKPGDMRENMNDAVYVTSGETAVFELAGDKDTDDSTSSAKGFKADDEINISGGTVDIDSADDSLHTGGNVILSGGTVKLSCGDDAIHADGDINITGGTLDIQKSHEGIEGMNVVIDGGNVNVNANDDGINCAGGSDSNSDGRKGRNEFAPQEGVSLRINGGVVTVVSSGDGLDSNGDLYITGGEVFVSGSTNGGNGALDYNGNAEISGGKLVACGAVGMEEGFGDGSSQYSVLYDLSSSVQAGEELTISDSSGKAILSYTPQINWQSVVFSSPDIADGETYTISCGDVSETVTVSGIVTSNAKGGFDPPGKKF